MCAYRHFSRISTHSCSFFFTLSNVGGSFRGIPDVVSDFHKSSGGGSAFGREGRLRWWHRAETPWILDPFQGIAFMGGPSSVLLASPPSSASPRFGCKFLLHLVVIGRPREIFLEKLVPVWCGGGGRREKEKKKRTTD